MALYLLYDYGTIITQTMIVGRQYSMVPHSMNTVVLVVTNNPKNCNIHNINLDAPSHMPFIKDTYKTHVISHPEFHTQHSTNSPNCPSQIIFVKPSHRPVHITYLKISLIWISVWYLTNLLIHLSQDSWWPPRWMYWVL